MLLLRIVLTSVLRKNNSSLNIKSQMSNVKAGIIFAYFLRFPLGALYEPKNCRTLLLFVGLRSSTNVLYRKKKAFVKNTIYNLQAICIAIPPKKTINFSKYIYSFACLHKFS